MLPERYRSGYELAVNDLGRREICLPAGATAGTAATRWHSYIHGSHLIKVTCRELAQDIPAHLALPADASAKVTATWLLALMDRKELLLPGYPEVRKLPDGYRRGQVSPDQCNCFISALWHILILLVLVFVPVLVYMKLIQSLRAFRRAGMSVVWSFACLVDWLIGCLVVCLFG